MLGHRPQTIGNLVGAIKGYGMDPVEISEEELDEFVAFVRHHCPNGQRLKGDAVVVSFSARWDPFFSEFSDHNRPIRLGGTSGRPDCYAAFAIPGKDIRFRLARSSTEACALSRLVVLGGRTPAARGTGFYFEQFKAHDRFKSTREECVSRRTQASAVPRPYWAIAAWQEVAHPATNRKLPTRSKA